MKSVDQAFENQRCTKNCWHTSGLTVVESYETKNKTLIPMKHKIEDVESYETKNRGCSFL